MSETYLHDVVELGDEASKMMFNACVATWPIRDGKYGQVNADLENFRGWRNWSAAPLLEVPRPEGIIFDQQGDGIGTKVRVTQQDSSYQGAAYDLTAMAVDDAAARGLEPVLMTTGFNVNRFTDENKPFMAQLARGAYEAAMVARVALYGGETAVLGNLVGGYGNPSKHLHYIWEATVHAAGHQERFVDGSQIQPGMALVGLHEPGLRSNGITMVRTTFAEAFGRQWHRRKFEAEEGPTTLGNAVLQGSVIYSPVLVDAIGGYDLRVKGRAAVEGAAHITGGGVTKLAEMLQTSGYGADIEDPFEPPEVMKHVLRTSGVKDRDAYGMFHMGAGMVVATSQPEKFIDVAQENNILAKVIGEVTKAPGVVIRSAGVSAPGRKLKFAA